MSRSARVLPLALLVSVTVAACSSASARPSAISGIVRTAAPSASATMTPQAVAALLSGCTAAGTLSSLRPLARLGGGPDDAVAASGGEVWISEHDGGRVVEIGADGALLRTIPDPQGPEGIEILADGNLLVAQQNPDRIDLLNPATDAFTSWLQLEPAASGEGIDGLGIDGTTLLVPDSAGGRLLLVPILSGERAGVPRVVATGLGRPVSAWPLGGGAYAVTLENPPGLVEASAGGGRRAILQETSLDDVVGRHGLLYVTNLSAGRLEAVDPKTGAERVLVNGAPDPQGLAVTVTGELVLVDEDAGVAVTVPSCG